MKYKFSSILYVNYSPYENAGYVLDFIVNKFKYVYMFSIGFHDLGENKGNNVLTIYKNGKKVEEKKYYHLKIAKKLEYLFVPVRSVINLFQIFSVTKYIYNKFGKTEIYLSVNAFTAWVGLVLKGFGYISKTTFWVWDYYPLKHNNLVILAMRWIYWQFDRISMFSNKVIFLNQKLADIHRNKKISRTGLKYSIIPIGTKLMKSKKNIKDNKLVLVFLGVLKKSQGLDFVIDAFPSLSKKFKNLELKIIGGGPDSEYFIKKSKLINSNIVFYGNISDKEIDRIISQSDIGIATYIPDKSNVSCFGDPSKVKRYLSYSLPVITTSVYDFSAEISNHHAGIVLKYGDRKVLASSIRKIKLNYIFYSYNAHALAKKYKYAKLYKEMFKIE